jgi:hypothetical protein
MQTALILSWRVKGTPLWVSSYLTGTAHLRTGARSSRREAVRRAYSMVLSTRQMHLSFSFFYHDSHETDTGTRETRGVSGLALVRLIVWCAGVVTLCPFGYGRVARDLSTEDTLLVRSLPPSTERHPQSAVIWWCIMGALRQRSPPIPGHGWAVPPLHAHQCVRLPCLASCGVAACWPCMRGL